MPSIPASLGKQPAQAHGEGGKVSQPQPDPGCQNYVSRQGMHARQRVSPQKITPPRRLSHTWQRSPCPLPSLPAARRERHREGPAEAPAQGGRSAREPQGQSRPGEAVASLPGGRWRCHGLPRPGGASHWPGSPSTPNGAAPLPGGLLAEEGGCQGTLPLLDPHRGPAGFQAGLRGRLPGPAERAAAGASAPRKALPPGERAETPGRLPPRASRWLNYHSHHPRRRG